LRSFSWNHCSSLFLIFSSMVMRASWSYFSHVPPL
jgi:hypothetical protein